MNDRFHLLIAGRRVDGASTMPVINPATGQAFAEAPRADAAQLEQAVAAAKAAFPAWAARPQAERRQALLVLADALAQHVEAFAALLTREQGKPLGQAVFECNAAVMMIRGLASLTLEDRVLRETATSRVVEQYLPLGVVAAITPWNFPLVLLVHKLAPALLAGNTLVVKPAPTTPLTTLRLGELCAQCLPAGVVNVVTDANDLGTLLCTHPDVAKIAFTGSTPTGRKVMASAATAIKRVTLELGGNDAALVLADADVPTVAARVFAGAMANAGQLCMAIKRVYVPTALYDDFCDALVTLARATVVGDGMDPATQLGPVQNAAQFERLQTLLAEAHARGQVLAGGAPLDRPGYFVPPTIVRDLPDDARLVCEEQFGPVLPVLAYTDVDDAVRRINDSEYGLTASVWGHDVAAASALAQRLHVGTVWVNTHMDMAPDLPFRGARQSGLGTELGQAGLLDYTQARVLNIALTTA